MFVKSLESYSSENHNVSFNVDSGCFSNIESLKKQLLINLIITILLKLIVLFIYLFSCLISAQS